MPGSRFLDLYAGTGAVGIEALSRGAAVVTFVESDPKALQLMRKNLTTCQLLDQADVRAVLTQSFLRQPDWWKGPYDILFADPPYADGEAVDLVLGSRKSGLLSQDALVIIEQSSRASLPASTDYATLIRRYAYGDTALFVYGAVDRKSASS